MSSIFIENYKRINVFISFYGFVGLNIGNQKGSFDSMWYGNYCTPPIGSTTCGFQSG